MDHQKLSYAIKRTITGLGLFAVKPIPKGGRIIEYIGPLISNEGLEKKTGRYFFGVNTKWSVDGSPRSNIARYINHSCRPNAEALISGRRVWIWSKKNIKAGEEITYDYGKEYFDLILRPIGCKCEKCKSKLKRSCSDNRDVRLVCHRLAHSIPQPDLRFP
jgi:SET domain-containing protein